MSEQKNAPQEIDLIELFTRMGRWIRSVSHTIFFGILYFFLRNRMKFIITISTGIIISLVIHKFGEKYYKCELIGYSHTIGNVEVIQFVNNWNFVASFDEYSEQMIRDIKATYLLDINNDGRWDMIEETEEQTVVDTAIINKRLYGNFCIQFQVYDTTIIPDLSSKLFAYLSQNKRVKEMNEIRLKQQNDMLPKIQKELSDLDSLKHEEYFKKESNETDKKNGSLLIWNEKEVKLYHNEILQLYERRQNIERNLYLFPEPFEIIQDFTVPRQAENSLVYLLIFWQKIVLALGFIVILIIDQRKGILNLIKQSDSKK